MYSDAGTYLAPAYSLIEKQAFLDWTGQPMVDRTPGYPTLLAAIMLLVGHDLHVVLVAQAAILSLGAVLLYYLARLVLPASTAFIAGLLAAFSPWGAVLAALPLSDGLLLFVLILIFLVMKLALQANKPGLALLGAVGVGSLTGIAVLVRPFWPLIVIVPAAWLLFHRSRGKVAWLLLVTQLFVASLPVALWVNRNKEQANFKGLSDIPGKTVWRYLAANVRSHAYRQSRDKTAALAFEEERAWTVSLSRKEADRERWDRAKAVFWDYPFITVYAFTLSVLQHTIHPSADVLTAVRLDFGGDDFVLAFLWGGLLVLACFGGYCILRWPARGEGIDRAGILMMLVVCSTLTIGSGLSFGQGSRLRAPLEVIVPLLAAAGLLRAAHGLGRCSILGKTKVSDANDSPRVRCSLDL